MTYRLAVVATGTGVGKTTTSLAILAAGRGSGLAVAGWKPLETGGNEDGVALMAASTEACATHVLLDEPISPHLAARRAGRRIDWRRLAEDAPRPAVDLLVIETAGGTFSPLDDEGNTNAELVEALQPDGVLLVAPNRLGVLHDVAAVLRAAPALAERLVAIALTGGAGDDASHSSNADELARLHRRAIWSFPTVDARPSELLAWLGRRPKPTRS